jgi:hypothetical protein
MNRLETPKTIRIIAAIAAAVTTFGLFHEVAMFAQPGDAQTGATQMAQVTMLTAQPAIATK